MVGQKTRARARVGHAFFIIDTVLLKNAKNVLKLILTRISKSCKNRDLLNNSYRKSFGIFVFDIFTQNSTKTAILRKLRSGIMVYF
jgi:hypothetical protein